MDQTEQARTLVSWMISGGDTWTEDPAPRRRVQVRPAASPITLRLLDLVARLSPTQAPRLSATECATC